MWYEQEKEKQCIRNHIQKRTGCGFPEASKRFALGASIVTLTGNHEAWIENYKGLIEYSDTFVLLQGKTCQICISGKCLSIDYYTNEDMKISGCIQCVRYE